MTTASDKVFIALFLAAVVASAAFQLNNVGYLLGFNAATLGYIALAFGVMSGNYWYKSPDIKPVDEQLRLTAWAVVPIALRWALQMPWFDHLMASTVTPFQQLGYMAQVLGLWTLVAVSEECFRAAMLNAADLILELKDKELQNHWRILVANTVWIAFHFFQRPLDLAIYWKYVVWLFASGLIMTYVMTQRAMGAAVLIHLITNLTA